MAFLKKIKYAFGFGDDLDDPIITDDPDASQPVPEPQQPQKQESAKASGSSSSASLETVDDSTGAQAIFDHVISVFNAALPDFLQKSIDPAAERKALYDSLSADMKSYVERSRVQAEEKCRRQWEKEKTRLQANVREMEARYKEFEDQRNEQNQKHLSAERQKRALSEKVHDLETKILSLEAEQEQFQLENKSLVNKLKVTSVYEKENAALREEIERLKQEKPQAAQEMTPEMMAQLQAIEAEMAKFEQIREKKDAQIASLKEQLESSKARIQSLERNVAMNLDMQSKSEKKLNDNLDAMRGMLAEKEQEIQTLRKQLGRLKKDGRGQGKDNKSGTPADNVTPIEDILSDTDWVVAPGSLRGNKKNSPNQNPQTDDKRNDDPQLSLF